MRAEAGRLDAGRVNRARDAVDSGVCFLRFLAGRGRSLGDAGQEDLDAFFATARRPFGATGEDCRARRGSTSGPQRRWAVAKTR